MSAKTGSKRARFDPTSTIDGRRHRVTLGLRPLDPADWLLVDEDFDAEIAHKSALLAARRGDVLAVLDPGIEASQELLESVVANLAEHHRDQPNRPQAGLTPIHAAALLVQEDLCVMTREPEGWVMTAACVCFPSRWRLADKMGKTVSAIHDPVPDYDDISAPVDLFFDRMSVERPMWRTNWTLLDDPSLHQPNRPTTGATDPGSWTFRVERQTLRKLPTTGAVVFTIRTYRRRLADLVNSHDTAASQLVATLATAGPAQVDYHAWQGLPDVIGWLREHIRTQD